ncbi:peptide ABC transporter substrate-binding protein [Amycolatopsis sp. CA-230715]|uniref:peptide ABC transporter substrate-binding protein n=1 Tax=Amycolatopsis sp. CA-230715 TaxID=2745196 RepID=UPI001C033D30|nr:ABC transporter substrate-binding protein [Amycolatopsis sp. CA-230715]QWF83508.1 Oligopeptide-binding protein OppA [Amycolatopsis sp. CA-230715]
MRRSRWVPAAVLLTSVSLLAACGGGGARSDSTVTVFGTEPQNGLVPSNTNEVGGNKALEPMFTKLVSFDSQTGAPSNAMAESIESSDAKTYDIKLKQGWKFHDGTEVKAKNFVDAWNWAANAKNGQLNSSFFEQIEGFDAVNPGKGKTPTADTMTGLRVVNDYEFKAVLKAPFSVFPTKVGYGAFAPLPDVFFKDPKAFAEHPIGNGPLKFVSRTPNVDMKLTRFDDYKGQDKVKFKDLTIKIYSSQETAYQDLKSGRLDFMEALPPSALADGKYKADLGENLVEGHLLGISTIAVPYYVPGYDNIHLRRAISMAINREQIVHTVLHDTYLPSEGWVPRGIEGYRPDVCGEACKYDPVKAKAELAQSGFTGKLTITANADGGRKESLVAACNSVRNALGIECDFVPATNFGQFRDALNNKHLTGMARSDWIADYHSIENFLNPTYKTNASSNDAAYSNATTDALLTRADSTRDKAAAIALYQQAEDQIAKDLPQIPVWEQKGVAAKSKNLKVAKLDFRRIPDYPSIELG